MSTFEVRKLFRADIVLKVTYRRSGTDTTDRLAFSKNLSSTGISFIARDNFSPETALDLAIHIGERQAPLRAKGVVKWFFECAHVPKSGRKYYSCGVQLVEMSPEDAIRGSDFVKNILKAKSEEQNRDIINKLEENRE